MSKLQKIQEKVKKQLRTLKEVSNQPEKYKTELDFNIWFTQPGKTSYYAGYNPKKGDEGYFPDFIRDNLTAFGMETESNLSCRLKITKIFWKKKFKYWKERLKKYTDDIPQSFKQLPFNKKSKKRKNDNAIDPSDQEEQNFPTDG